MTSNIYNWYDYQESICILQETTKEICQHIEPPLGFGVTIEEIYGIKQTITVMNYHNNDIVRFNICVTDLLDLIVSLRKESYDLLPQSIENQILKQYTLQDPNCYKQAAKFILDISLSLVSGGQVVFPEIQ